MFIVYWTLFGILAELVSMIVIVSRIEIIDDFNDEREELFDRFVEKHYAYSEWVWKLFRGYLAGIIEFVIGAMAWPLDVPLLWIHYKEFYGKTNARQPEVERERD